VAETTTEELNRADQAFAGNYLLSTFSPEARQLIEPFGTMVELNTGETALTRGEQVTASLFPIGPTLISMEVELAGGRPGLGIAHCDSRRVAWEDVIALAPEVKCPILFIRGDKENAERYPAEEFVRRATAPAIANVIADCDHFYNGRENEVIDAVNRIDAAARAQQGLAA